MGWDLGGGVGRQRRGRRRTGAGAARRRLSCRAFVQSKRCLMPGSSRGRIVRKFRTIRLRMRRNGYPDRAVLPVTSECRGNPIPFRPVANLIRRPSVDHAEHKGVTGMKLRFVSAILPDLGIEPADRQFSSVQFGSVRSEYLCFQSGGFAGEYVPMAYSIQPPPSTKSPS